MTRVSTIGYEGADISAFLSTLSEAGVRTVADIRDVPVSRKKGFSKNKLAAALEEVGIGYVHLKQLGDPKEGREAMRRGDREHFLRVFHAHIDRSEAQDALDQLAFEVSSSETVLLCYERDPKDCHRTIVASMLKERGEIVEVRHLGVRNH